MKLFDGMHDISVVANRATGFDVSTGVWVRSNIETNVINGLYTQDEFIKIMAGLPASCDTGTPFLEFNQRYPYPKDNVGTCGITRDFLQHIALASATKDYRHYLNAIAFDFESNCIIASDGHRMHVGDSAGMNGSGFYILPIVAVKKALAAKADLTIHFMNDASITHAIIVCDDIHETVISARTIDYQYPPYKSVIPQNGLRLGETSDILAAVKAGQSLAKKIKWKSEKNKKGAFMPCGIHFSEAGAFLVHSNKTERFQLDSANYAVSSDKQCYGYEMGYLTDIVKSAHEKSEFLIAQGSGVLLVKGLYFQGVIMPFIL